jgi:hypothetical protein
MKINVVENGVIQIEDIFNPIKLKTNNETVIICARDNGFEMKYQNKIYYIKNGIVEPSSLNDVHVPYRSIPIPIDISERFTGEKSTSNYERIPLPTEKVKPAEPKIRSIYEGREPEKLKITLPPKFLKE